MRIRPPAVAGSFYPADPSELRRELLRFLGSKTSAARSPAFGAVVPHAGYIYSGRVAGAVFSRLEIPRRIVILCPNHTGRGTAASLAPEDAWATPLGDVRLDATMREKFLELCPSLHPDDRAHRQEHALEVELPFLQVLRADFLLTAICIGEMSLPLCREIGDAFATIRSDMDEPLLLLASSDMNHYESRAITNRKNAMAFEKIEALDPPGLFETCLTHNISMCGLLPATALLYAAGKAGEGRVAIVATADSGDETGDTSSVVGYAGIIVG